MVPSGKIEAEARSGILYVSLNLGASTPGPVASRKWVGSQDLVIQRVNASTMLLPFAVISPRRAQWRMAAP